MRTGWRNLFLDHLLNQETNVRLAQRLIYQIEHISHLRRIFQEMHIIFSRSYFLLPYNARIIFSVFHYTPYHDDNQAPKLPNLFRGPAFAYKELTVCNEGDQL